MAYTLNAPNAPHKKIRSRTTQNRTTRRRTVQPQVGAVFIEILREHGLRPQEAHKATAAERRQLSEDRDNYHIYREMLSDIHTDLFHDGAIDETRQKDCIERLGLCSPVGLSGLHQTEFNLFIDYAFYVHCVDAADKTIIDQYVAAHQSTECQVKRQMLPALSNVEFTILRIQDVIAPGARGVLNLRTMQTHVMRDEALACFAHHKGLLLAGNILHFPNFIMGTGAALPLLGRLKTDTEALKDIGAACAHYHQASRQDRSTWIGQFTRQLLEAGSADRIIGL